jgi:hypothetical protein
LHPPFYRCCWHEVSRCLYPNVCWGLAVYNLSTFIPHAASLRQAFAHCARFLAAASRRSRTRVSVSLWLTTLSSQLPVCLGEPLSHQQADRTHAPPKAGSYTLYLKAHAVLSSISRSYSTLWGRFVRVTHPSAMTYLSASAWYIIRLACLRHAASIHPELRSNS